MTNEEMTNEEMTKEEKIAEWVGDWTKTWEQITGQQHGREEGMPSYPTWLKRRAARLRREVAELEELQKYIPEHLTEEAWAARPCMDKWDMTDDTGADYGVAGE